MTNEEIISFNIKRERKSKGYTQQAIANEIGVNLKTYNFMENKPNDYPISRLKLISDVLGINVYRFFVGLDIPNRD